MFIAFVVSHVEIGTESDAPLSSHTVHRLVAPSNGCLLLTAATYRRNLAAEG
ncbi:hypothetical protein CP488_02288 [Chthonomonas calidirosea]|nr:hypothetical protein CP488_02288 [Chthonomonas calidirosea]